MTSTTKTMDTYIGKSVEKVDALDRVTGKASFGADIHLPGMLHGKVLRSPHPHARIKKIDTEKALALSGVEAVITANDLPPIDRVEGTVGGELLVSLLDLRKMTIAHDKALYDGHSIAAVAATTPEIAAQALDLIEVDYEILPTVEDAINAMEPSASLLHEDLYTKTLGERSNKPSNIAMYTESNRGSLDEGLANADLIHETTYSTKMVHQGYLEPTTAVAWVQADGKATIWSSTQGTFGIRRSLAQLLEFPLHKINVIPMEVGGAFGGKIYAILEPLAMLLSDKTRRPVKMVMSRAEVFRATGPGSPMHATIKTGTKKDGTLTACYAKIIMDAGAFPGSPIGGASVVSFGPYKVDNLKIEGYDVVTNKPRVQAYRAPGGTPIAFAVESHLDEVAEKLGIDPLDFRMINAAEEGDRGTNDQPYNRIGVKDVLKRISAHPCWKTPLDMGTHRGRGLALGYWQGATLTSSASIIVNSDGTITMLSGQVDLTGTRTTMQQIVAQEMQVPIENVTVRVGDTESTTYTDLSAGSRTGYSLGAAAHAACKDAISHLKIHAATQFEVDPADIEYTQGKFWVRENSEQNVTLAALAQNSTRRASGPISGYGTVTRLQAAHQFAGHVVDVEVDIETGKVSILRYTTFQDVGKAINPVQVEGQMQGGAVQGIGWALTEYYHYKDGVLKNPTLLDYRIPTSLDIPMIDTEIIEVPASDGPYGVRGVGEVPIVPPAAALANAIYRATGTRMYSLPMTPEEVFKATRKLKRA